MFFKGIRNGVKSTQVQNRAEIIVDVAERKMQKAKTATNSAIQDLGRLKLQIYGTDIKEFVDIFSRIKEVDFQDSLIIDEYKTLDVNSVQLREMETASVNALDALKGLAAGAGAGVLAGWGTCSAVMALGTASTGAAISGLSGAAATNATLAWLGGGAIAAGGGGMALGALVLGGIVAGPALFIAGGIIGAKGTESLNNAKSNLAAAKKLDSDVNLAIKELEVIQEKIAQVKSVIQELQKNAVVANKCMKSLGEKKNNWKLFSLEEKKTVFSAFKTIQILKKIIELPLLTEDGVLTLEMKNLEKYISEIS